MQNTSLQAYKAMQPKIKTDHDRILSVLSLNRGFTYNEIAKLLNWDNPVKVARRLPELVRMNLIAIKEVRKCQIVNNNCSSYIKLINHETN